MYVYIYIHIYIYIYIYTYTYIYREREWSHEDNPMHPSYSSPQSFCGDMPASGGVRAVLVLELTEYSTSTEEGT